MKREVIFRGWSPTAEQWVYGTGFHLSPGGEASILGGAGILIAVNAATIGEWTGETNDEVGFRRIFEGDFLAVRHGKNAKTLEGPFFVRFEGHGFEMCDFCGEVFPLATWNAVVIGNEFENSDLHHIETKFRTLEEFRRLAE